MEQLANRCSVIELTSIDRRIQMARSITKSTTIRNILIALLFSICLASSAFSQIVEPPPSLPHGTVSARHLGSVHTDVIPGARVSKDLRTNLVADIRGMPAPVGATSQREAAEAVLRQYGHLMGINSDLSNLAFRREKLGLQSSKVFSWDQTYNGYKLSEIGLISIEVLSDLRIAIVNAHIEAIINPQPISFPITSQQAITAAINILSAGSVPDPRPTAEQRVLVENGTPRGVWVVTFGNGLRIPWAIVVDGTTGEPLLGHRTDKY